MRTTIRSPTSPPSEQRQWQYNIETTQPLRTVFSNRIVAERSSFKVTSPLIRSLISDVPFGALGHMRRIHLDRGTGFMPFKLELARSQGPSSSSRWSTGGLTVSSRLVWIKTAALIHCSCSAPQRLTPTGCVTIVATGLPLHLSDCCFD